MSKSLIRFIDESIFPPILIIGLKIFGIIFINDIFSLSYYFQSVNNLYYRQASDVIAVNTYSDIFVYIGILFVIIFLILRLLFFTDNKTSPTMLLKLAKFKKVQLIRTSIDLYHTIFVWMVFFTGLTIYLSIRSFVGIDYLFLGIISIIIYMLIFWIMLKEIEKDIVKKIELSKENLI